MTAMHARLALAGLIRAPGRTVLRIVVVAAAIALLAAMLLFIGNSLRSASAAAVRQVPLDWQGPVSSAAQAQRAAQAVAKQPGVAQASATATAPFASSTHTGPAGSTTTANGSILAVPANYSHDIHTFRLLHGSLKPGGVVLDQQMAATLQAQIGDTVKLIPQPGSKPQPYKVTGVGLITAPDQVFQPLNPSVGPTPAQPPENAVIMQFGTFKRTLGPQLPPVTTASALANSQPGAQKGVQWQVQAQLDRAPLEAGSPSAAFTLAGQTLLRVERSVPGRVQFVDNLSDSLNTAAQDSLYAQTLYIMLAVPGALIALGVAYLAALGASERERRDLALLRARGARRRDLVTLALVESAAVGVIAGLIGAAIGLAAVQLLVSGGAQLTTGRTITTVIASVLLGIAGAAAARLAATASVLGREVSEGRRSAVRDRKPFWQRYYLDFLALALSGLIYWLTVRTGFSAVVNPDSNPTLSLSVYMFGGPALLWIGATLLLVRLRGRLLSWLAGRASRGNRESQLSFLLASAGRRGAAINRGLVVIGLLLAFGVSLAVFSATYDQQAQVDAQLTLGADVTVSAPPGTTAKANLPAKVASVPGVTATTALDHSYAYVGPDLQDTFGIDPSTFPKATTLRDSYFIGGTASQLMSRLQQTRDGIMVSQETITDYSLKPGRPAEAPRPRPAHRQVSRRPLPRHRHRAGVPLRTTRLVHGHQRELPRARDSRTGSERGVREHERKPGRGCDSGGRHHPQLRHHGQEPRPAGRADRELDHDGRPHRDQPHRGGVRGGARRRGDGALRCDRDRRAASRARHDGGDRRPAAAHRGVRVERGRPRAGRRAAPGRRARLADGTDAGRHAHPCLRPSAGPPRDPLGLPGRARRGCRRGDARRLPAGTPPAGPHAAGRDPS